MVVDKLGHEFKNVQTNLYSYAERDPAPEGEGEITGVEAEGEVLRPREQALSLEGEGWERGQTLPKPSKLLAMARRMRRQPTDAENLLWQRLKAKRLEGWKFRRQEPVAGYVADFLCYDARLVIEVDGGQHAADADRDEQRTMAIAAEGFRVVRFWNNEVLENIEGVLETIVGHLEK